jgi:hypothetical protein
MTADLREALEGALGWCIEQAERIMAISAGAATTHGDDSGALQIINSMASDIAINLQMALASDPHAIDRAGIMRE